MLVFFYPCLIIVNALLPFSLFLDKNKSEEEVVYKEKPTCVGFVYLASRRALFISPNNR